MSTPNPSPQVSAALAELQHQVDQVALDKAQNAETMGLMFAEHEKRLGQYARQRREGAGWSQADLAAKLTAVGIPMHQTTIAKLEAGRRPIRVSEAVALAQVFGLPLAALIWSPPFAGESFTEGQMREMMIETEAQIREHRQQMLDAVEMYSNLYADAQERLRRFMSEMQQLGKGHDGSAT